MGIFLNDDRDDSVRTDDVSIESGAERVFFESAETISPIEARLLKLKEAMSILEKAIREKDPDTIESLDLQVIAYKEELETVQQEKKEIDSVLEKEHNSPFSSAILKNELMRLERWELSVTGYIKQYEAFLSGNTVPEVESPVDVANLIKAWHVRVQGNIQTLERAVQEQDSHALELLGHSLENYKRQEFDFEKTVSDMHERLKEERLGDGVRAILASDEVYLLNLLDDLRYYISEYSRVLREQVRKEIESV